MRVSLWALIVGAASVTIACAQAADVKPADEQGVKPLKVGVEPGFWSGWYLGAQGGGTWADLKFTPGTPREKENGGFGGLQGGYNRQLDNRLVIGAEVDYSWSNLSKKNVPDGNFIRQGNEIDGFGSARLRLGYATGPILPYLAGGLFWANTKLSETCPQGAQFGFCRPVANGGQGPYNVSSTQTTVGWTVGGGLEYSITKQLSAKFEYLYTDLGNETFDFPAGTARSRSPEQSLDIVRFGVNYRFNLEPISLK